MILVLLALGDAAVVLLCWLWTRPALIRSGASREAHFINAVRCLAAGVILFSAEVLRPDDLGLLALGLAATLLLIFLPKSWLLVLDDKAPVRRLWTLNRRALVLGRSSAQAPLDAQGMWETILAMARVDTPDLSELRDLLIWRYLAFFDPQTNRDLETLREVRIDALERRIWGPMKLPGKSSSPEQEMALRIHQTVGEFVSRVRSASASTADVSPDELAKVGDLRGLASSATVDAVLKWAQSVGRGRHAVEPAPADAALPEYMLPDGAVTTRTWLDTVPSFGEPLSEGDLQKLRAASDDVRRRLQGAL